MGLNDPDKNKDPWSGDNQPPDIDEAIKKLRRKMKIMFSSLFGNKRPNNVDSSDSSGGFIAMVVGGIALLLWLLSGVFIVDPAEQAVIMRFGKYVETVGPGPHWIPRLLSSKIVVNVDRVSDYSYSAQMLTKDENLVSVAVAVQYRIGDLQEYLFNVADPEESLRQATSSALRQVVGSTTLDQIITEGREAWGSSVQEALVSILANYKVGIVIVNVSPQPARAPESVQDAFDDAIKAQEDEKRFKEQARAYEARVIPIAMGNAKRIRSEAKAFAEQVVLQAKGETAEFLALLPEYVKTPAVTSSRMYIDAMQTILGSSSKILVDAAKAGNLLYLPLDKLAVNQTSLDEPTHSVSHTTTSMDETNAASTTFEGRTLVRPTEILRGSSR
jgi:membrane protease subunit HflK